MAQGNTAIDRCHVLQTHYITHVHMYLSCLHLFTPTTANRKSTKKRHVPPHIGTAMINMMVLLPASVLVTVGVATLVTGTAAVVGVPMSKGIFDSGGRF